MAWRKPGTVNEWMDIVFRHKKKFFFAAVPVAVVVLAASHYVPRRYTAQSQLKIEKGLVASLMRNATTDIAVKPLRDLLAQDIKSRSTAEQVFYDLELDRDLPHNPDGTLTAEGIILKSQTLEKMQGNIGVTYLARTPEVDRVIVSYTDENRALVDEVVNQLADNYVNQASKQFEETLVRTKQFFETKSAEARQKLSDAETEKMRFDQENPGLNPNDPGSIETRLTTLTARYDALEEKIGILRQERLAQERWIKEQPLMIEVTRDVLAPELQARLATKAQLEQDLIAFKNKAGLPTDSHPVVLRLKAQIAQLEAEISGDEFRTVKEVQELQPNLALFEAEKEIETMSGQLEAMENQFDNIRREIELYQTRKSQFTALRAQYQQLQRDITEYTSIRSVWENRLQQTQTALQAVLGERSLSMAVVERPDPITKPSSPTIAKILMAALVLGIGAGALMILLAELADRSFRSVQHAVDDLKLPVLGTVNEIQSATEMFRNKVLGWGVYPALAGVMVIVLTVSIYLANLSLTNPERYEEITHSQALVGR